MGDAVNETSIFASPCPPVSPSSVLVAVEGIEPTSLDYQSSALAVELHRESIAEF
jgi:hypothetical protein